MCRKLGRIGLPYRENFREWWEMRNFWRKHFRGSLGATNYEWMSPCGHRFSRRKLLLITPKLRNSRKFSSSYVSHYMVSQLVVHIKLVINYTDSNYANHIPNTKSARFKQYSYMTVSHSRCNIRKRCDNFSVFVSFSC